MIVREEWSRERKKEKLWATAPKRAPASSLRFLSSISEFDIWYLKCYQTFREIQESIFIRYAQLILRRDTV